MTRVQRQKKFKRVGKKDNMFVATENLQLVREYPAESL